MVKFKVLLKVIILQDRKIKRELINNKHLEEKVFIVCRIASNGSIHFTNKISTHQRIMTKAEEGVRPRPFAKVVARSFLYARIAGA